MQRKIMASLVGVVLMAFSAASQTSQRIIKGSFLPPNNMRIPVGSKDAKGITEQQFNQVLDQLQAVYGPIVAAKGGTLLINRLWDDPTVNASAERIGDSYVLNMYGGLARYESITQDGFTLVACHEMGHHLGGAPKIAGADWASNEGEADYFANLKCLRRVFSSQGSKTFTRFADDNEVARAACAQSFSKPADQALCLRGALAGVSVTALLRGDGPPTHFDTPDLSVVLQTNDDHPAAQCRLDTYFQGSLCARPYTEDVSDADPAAGTCVHSQGFTVGLRPLCWYKPPASEGNLLSSVPKASGPLFKGSQTMSTLKTGNVWQGL